MTNKQEGNSILSNDEQKELLKATITMYENTKAETRKKRKEMTDKNGGKIYSDKSTQETIKLLDTMENDIIEQFIKLGGTNKEIEEAKKVKTKKDRKKVFEKYMTSAGIKDQMQKYLESKGGQDESKPEKETVQQVSYGKDEPAPFNREYEYSPYPVQEREGEIDDYIEDEVETFNEPVQMPSSTYTPNNRIQFDNIPLPSRGECYRNKMSSIPVAYLTAYDENMIVSPNLYKDGNFLDYLIKTKVMNNNINTDDLLPGDRDAIVLWLRASGYGPVFPVQVTDPETKETFETTINLTDIKYAPFKLKGDSNGYFKYKLPLSGDIVKFKFLSYGDVKRLNSMEEDESKSVRKEKMDRMLFDMRSFIDRDSDIDSTQKKSLLDCIGKLEDYNGEPEDDDRSTYTHAVTNRLIESIVEVNNVTDRKYIAEYVAYMSVQDSSALRKYISDNEPGLDFNLTVEKPASLGGGSMPMFLSLDQYLFLNIAQ